MYQTIAERPDLVIGQRVDVRDGTPPPPARFNKKLSAWKNKNFSGVLTELEPAGKYGARCDTASILVQDVGFIRVTRSGWPLNVVTAVQA